MKIRVLKRNEINLEKWDKCVFDAPNGSVYGMSWYLNRITDNWLGVIANDYEAVLPLPIKTKFGAMTIYQPFFTQKFAIFSKHDLTQNLITDFLKNIPQKTISSVLNLDISPQNNFYNFETSSKVNQELQLIYDTETTYNQINKHHKRYFRKAQKANVVINENGDLKNPLLMKKFIHQRNNINPPKDIYDKYQEIIKYNVENCGGLIYDAYVDDELCASAFFKKFKNRFILFSGANDLGRRSFASYLLIKNFIDNFTNTDTILDFAGSNILSVASWNEGFGATKSYFTQISKYSALYQIRNKIRRS